jgi:hypothetical protein
VLSSFSEQAGATGARESSAISHVLYQKSAPCGAPAFVRSCWPPSHHHSHLPEIHARLDTDAVTDRHRATDPSATRSQTNQLFILAQQSVGSTRWWELGSQFRNRGANLEGVALVMAQVPRGPLAVHHFDVETKKGVAWFPSPPPNPGCRQGCVGQTRSRWLCGLDGVEIVRQWLRRGGCARLGSRRHRQLGKCPQSPEFLWRRHSLVNWIAKLSSQAWQVPPDGKNNV